MIAGSAFLEQIYYSFKNSLAWEFIKYFRSLLVKTVLFQSLPKLQLFGEPIGKITAFYWRRSSVSALYHTMIKKWVPVRLHLNSKLTHWRRIFEGLLLLLIVLLPVFNAWGLILTVLFLLWLSNTAIRKIPGELIVFGAVLWVSAIFSPGFQAGYATLALDSTWILTACLIGKTFTGERRTRLMNYLLWTSLIWIIIGFFQQWSGIATPPGWLGPEQSIFINIRSYSVFINPNIYALYLFMILSLAIERFNNTTGWRRFFGIVFFVLSLSALYFTYSRIVWIFTGLYLSMMLWRSLGKRGIFIAVIGLIFLMTQIGFQIRFLSLVQMTDSSFWYRLRIWQGVGRAIANNWVWGLGPDSFLKIYPWYQIGNTFSFHAHQLYLQLWLENGIFSLMAFIVLIKRLFTGLRPCQKSVEVLSIILMVFLGCGFSESWFQNRFIGGYFWLFCGLLISAMNEEKMAG